MRLSKVTRAVSAALLAVLVVAGCSSEEPAKEVTESTSVETSETADPQESTEDNSGDDADVAADRPTVRVGMIPGFPSISMANLLAENEAGTSANHYETTLASAPDEIVAKMTTGELDVATVPTNMAATLYNRTEGEVQIAAINTLGVIKVVTTDPEITSLEDLGGQQIDASGKGAIPEYTFNYILDELGMAEDVDVTYFPGHDEVASRIIAGQTTLATIPEPTLSAVSAQVPELTIVADLTEEWNAINPDVVLSQGALVIRTEFIEENPDAVAAFLEEYEASARLVNEDVEQTAANTGEFDIVPENIAREAIPRANQVYISGEEMKEGLEPFFQILFDGNPESIGGALPGEDFYYIP